METLQKAGAFALIFGAKCLRHALTTLAEMQDGADRARLTEDDGVRALRDEMEAMQASLRELKAVLYSGPSSDDGLLQ